MGCGGSKQDDIGKSRQRQPVQATPNVQPSTQTTPVASPMSAKKQESTGENASEYGKSYTDMKNKEKLMFMNIITKAQHNLIDMRQSPGLGEENGEEEEQVQPSAPDDTQETNLPIDPLQYIDLYGLPTVSEQVQTKPIKDVFCEGNLTLDDVQQLSRFTSAILQAYGSIKVNDENMEPLVVSLPEIEI